MGTQHILAAGTTSSSSSSFLIIILIFGVMMIFLFRSQRRRQRAAVDTQRKVMDGSKIRTTFGLFGTVMSGDDRTVMVEIAPGVQIKLLRQAIATVVPDEEPDGGYGTMPDPAEDDKPGNRDERTDLSI
ncbi:MAG: preprotein translocase subunit YajC [Streptosporangiaceae bacterium]